MRRVILHSIAIVFALVVLLLVVPLAAQVPGGPTGWGWCAICGKDVYLPTHSHGSQGSRGGNVSTPNTYSVVWIRNKTDHSVTYQLCSLYDNSWSTYTIQPGGGRYHWYRPFSRFSVVFTSDGVRRQYGLNGNFVSGRMPAADDGRLYDFVAAGAGFDLRVGSDLPPDSPRRTSRPTVPASPPSRPAADPDFEAYILRQREAAEAILRENAERMRNLAERRVKINAVLNEGREAMRAMQYARAIQKFDEAGSLARADPTTEAEFDTTACLREIAHAWGMLGRETFRRGDYVLADTQYAKAITNSADPTQRRGWQDERESVQRQRTEEEAFHAAVERGKSASQRGEFAEAVRNFEAALARRANDKATRQLLAEAQGKLHEQAERDLRAQLAELAENGLDQLVAAPLPAVPPPGLPREPKAPLLGPAATADDGLFDILLAMADRFEDEVARSATPGGITGRVESPVESDLSALFGTTPLQSLDDSTFEAMLARGEQLKRELVERDEARERFDPATLSALEEEQARQSVSDYYLTLSDEASRKMRVEWAEELGRLQKSGLMPRGVHRREEIRDHPELTVAVQQAAEDVMARFVERKRDALCEAEQLLHVLEVQRGTIPEVARRMADTQTRLAWEASQEFTAVRRRAEEQSLASIQRLTESGLLRRNVPLHVQAERDPLAREAIDRYLAPVEARLRAEQQRIRDEHQQRLSSEIATIKASVTFTPAPSRRPEPASGPRTQQGFPP